MIELPMGQPAAKREAAGHWIWEPLVVFGVSRGALFLLAFAGQVLVPLHPGSTVHPSPSSLFLNGWFRWDADWYLSIVIRGYSWDPGAHSGNVAFFPLYPILVSLVGRLIGNFNLAALVASNLCFALALVLLYAFVLARFDRPVARRTVLFVAFAPFALFYGAVYTESLFLLCAVLSFWLVERDQWWLGCLVGMLCSMTRLIGLTLGPALLLLYLQQRKFQPRRIGWNILSLGLIPLGTALYAVYLGIRVGDPLAFYQASLYGWARYNIFVSGLGRLNPSGIHPGNYDLVLGFNLILALLVLIAAIPTFRLVGPAYAVFVVLATVIPLSAGLESLGRYVTILFPFYIVVSYYARGRLATRLIVFGSAGALGLFTVLFVNWYWII